MLILFFRERRPDMTIVSDRWKTKSQPKILSMNAKKEIFEKIADVKEEVLLGDVVKVLRALNEDIDNVIEVGKCKKLNMLDV